MLNPFPGRLLHLPGSLAQAKWMGFVMAFSSKAFSKNLSWLGKLGSVAAWLPERERIWRVLLPQDMKCSPETSINFRAKQEQRLSAPLPASAQARALPWQEGLTF